MLRPEKEEIVAEFDKIIEGAQSVYVADYQGLTVPQISELRTPAFIVGSIFSCIGVVPMTLLLVAAVRRRLS